jgi:DNA-binding winged helix-turn-helix (wHTH) protein
MRLLLCLAEHAGEVVSIDDLLNQVWTDVIVAPDSVYQAVTSLRRLLGDDPKQPTYIATVPRLGYRMVATVSPWADQSVAQTGTQTNAQTPGGGPSARRFALRSSLLFCSTARSRTIIPQPHPPLLHSHRNPSPCCRFST